MRKAYSVRSMFLTVQGEGSRTGAKSLFVRLAGCNLWDGHPEHRASGKGACARWCDTDFAQGEPMPLAKLLDSMNALSPRTGSESRWCVITGGEPTLQMDLALVEGLHREGWSVALETNGTLDPVSEGTRVLDQVDHICCSPKRGGEVVIRHAHELKVVLPGDALQPWTEGELLSFYEKLHPDAAFVQPQDAIDPSRTETSFLGGQRPEAEMREVYQGNVRRCLDFVYAHPAWRLSLQTHKYLGVP
ncbi:MAG TPA: hypothetical protein VEY30_00720 [Myxococcaceae bacterium]|nr:hypothetical protein [Myxococcaceae bacterium]